MHHTNGFTYVGVMILIAIISIFATLSVQVGVVLQRRAAEEELLLIGMEFRNALTSYANATPPGKASAPRSLEDLLRDPRYPTPRRHLRKIYIDPVTGKDEWGTVPAGDGSGIGGVFSLSNAVPIKIDNFAASLQDFTGKSSYREWIFSPIQVVPVHGTGKYLSSAQTAHSDGR